MLGIHVRFCVCKSWNTVDILSCKNCDSTNSDEKRKEGTHWHPARTNQLKLSWWIHPYSDTECMSCNVNDPSVQSLPKDQTMFAYVCIKRWCNISWHCALMSSKTLHGSPSNLTGSAGFIFCPQLNHGVLPDKMQVLCLQFLTCMDDVEKISQDWSATIWHDLMQCRLLPVGLPYLIGHWHIVHNIYIIIYVYIWYIHIIFIFVTWILSYKHWLILFLRCMILNRWTPHPLQIFNVCFMKRFFLDGKCGYYLKIETIYI